MLIDTHTHTNMEQFKDDYEDVISRALAADVWMINVGTDMPSSQKAVEIAYHYEEGVYAACGLHPNDVTPTFDFGLLEKYAKDKKVVGIGETGLDYFRTEGTEKQAQQIEFFMKHIEIAKKNKKALIVHCRDAHDDAIKTLKANAGDSFSGVITFARDYDEAIKYAPIDRILVETDAPFVSPEPERGKRNEPYNVTYTARKLAEIKGLSFEEISQETTKNARELFKI